MSEDFEEVDPLPERIVAGLRSHPPMRSVIEDATVARLRANDLLGSSRGSKVRRWLPQAIAATVLFAAGVALGRSQAIHDPRALVAASGSPVERIEAAEALYISALDATVTTDSLTVGIAAESYRRVSNQIVRLIPEFQLGFAMTTIAASSTTNIPGVTGKSERVAWY